MGQLQKLKYLYDAQFCKEKDIRTGFGIKNLNRQLLKCFWLKLENCGLYDIQLVTKCGKIFALALIVGLKVWRKISTVLKSVKYVASHLTCTSHFSKGCT